MGETLSSKLTPPWLSYGLVNQVCSLGNKICCLGLQEEQQRKSKKKRSKSNQEKWQNQTKKPPPKMRNKKQLKKSHKSRMMACRRDKCTAWLYIEVFDTERTVRYLRNKYQCEKYCTTRGTVGVKILLIFILCSCRAGIDLLYTSVTFDIESLESFLSRS